MAPIKVLFAGDVQGKFDALFKRVAAVNSSNGPFDYLLCVGAFFPAKGGDDAEYQGELTPYLKGEKRAPVPTYFVGGWGAGSRAALAALALAPDSNITYLGRRGVTSLRGLNVAFLDGTYNAAAFRAGGGGEGAPGCRFYTEADLAALRLQLQHVDGDVDVLLTSEWPDGVCAGLPDAGLPALPAGASLAGSAAGREVATLARPRYQVAAGKGVFFTRPPYLNADLGAGSHATRFISLGEVGNAGKQKWVHALGLTPASEMTPEQLQAVPEGATPCPYTSDVAGGGSDGSRKRGAAGGPEDLGSQDWRWQQQQKKQKGGAMAQPSLGRPDIAKDKRRTVFVRNVPFRATEDDLVSFFSQVGQVEDVVRRNNAEGRLNTFGHIQFDSEDAAQRACQLNGTELLGRPLGIDMANLDEDRPKQQRAAKPVDGCWFCLSNPNADVELVASIGEECYVALDKGAITGEHVLVLPVEHYASSQAATPGAYAEMERYLSALRSCFACSGRELVGFERYMALRKSGGNHCHFNAIAVSAAAGAGAAEAFTATAARQGFEMKHLPPATGEAARAALREAVGEGEYFVALLPDGSRLVHPIAFGERFPLSFGREVLAGLVGSPEKADWKNCAVPPGEETARCEAFKEAFKPFDIMSGDS